MSECQRSSHTPPDMLQTCPRHDVRSKTQFELTPDMPQTWCLTVNAFRTHPRHVPDMMFECQQQFEHTPDMMFDWKRSPNLSPDMPRTSYPSVNTGSTDPRHTLDMTQTRCSNVKTQSKHIPNMMFECPPRYKYPLTWWVINNVVRTYLQTSLRHDIRVSIQAEHTPDMP